jgi:hypothetical protein
MKLLAFFFAFAIFCRVIVYAQAQSPVTGYSDQVIAELATNLQNFPTQANLTQAAKIISQSEISEESSRILTSAFRMCLDNPESRIMAWTALENYECSEFDNVLLAQLETESNWVHPELFEAISKCRSREAFYRLAEIGTAPVESLPIGFSDRQPVWDAMFAIDGVQATSVALSAYDSFLVNHPGTPTVGENPVFVEETPPKYYEEVRPITLEMLQTNIDSLLHDKETTAAIAPSIVKFLFYGSDRPQVEKLFVGYKNGERRAILATIEKDLIAQRSFVSEALLLFFCDVDDAELSNIADSADYSSLKNCPWILNYVNWTRFLFLPPDQRPHQIQQAFLPWLIKARAKLLSLDIKTPKGTERFPLPCVMPITQSNSPTFCDEEVSDDQTNLLVQENADYRSLLWTSSRFLLGPQYTQTNLDTDMPFEPVQEPFSEESLENRTFLNAAEYNLVRPPPGVIFFDPSFMDATAKFLMTEELSRRALLAYALLICPDSRSANTQQVSIANLDQLTTNAAFLINSCDTKVVDTIAKVNLQQSINLSLPGPGPYRIIVQQRSLSFASNTYYEYAKIVGSTGRSLDVNWIGPIPDYLTLALRTTPRLLDLMGISLFANEIKAKLHPQIAERSDISLISSDGPYALDLLLIHQACKTLSWQSIRTILEADEAERMENSFSPLLAMDARSTILRTNLDIVAPSPTNSTEQSSNVLGETEAAYGTKFFGELFNYFVARETLRIANELVGPVNNLQNTVGEHPDIQGGFFTFLNGFLGGPAQNGLKVVWVGHISDLQQKANDLFASYPGPSPNTSELAEWDFTPDLSMTYYLIASTCTVSSDAKRALVYTLLSHFPAGQLYENDAEVNTQLPDDVREKLLQSLRIDPFWLTRDHITFLASTTNEPATLASEITRIGDYNSRLAILLDTADRGGMAPVFFNNIEIPASLLSEQFPTETPESSILRSQIAAMQSWQTYLKGSDLPLAAKCVDSSFVANLSSNFQALATESDVTSDEAVKPIIDALNNAANPPQNDVYGFEVTWGDSAGPNVGVDLSVGDFGIHLSFNNLDSTLDYSLLTEWDKKPLPLIVSGALGEPPSMIQNVDDPISTPNDNYISLPNVIVGASSIGQQASEGSLIESSAIEGPKEGATIPYFAISSPPLPFKSARPDPITGNVHPPKNIGQFTYNGDTWYVSEVQADGRFEVWARTTSNGFSEQDKLLFTVSTSTTSMSEIGKFACSTKEELEQDKLLVGCGATGGAFAICAAGAFTENPQLIGLCYESLDATFDGPLAACLDGLRDKIAKAIVRDPAFSSLRAIGGVQEGDWTEGISAALDLLCHFYLSIPDEHVLTPANGTDYSELLWAWGQYYEEYAALTPQERITIEDALNRGIVTDEVKSILAKNSSTSNSIQGFQWLTDIVPELVPPTNFLGSGAEQQVDKYISDFNKKSDFLFEKVESAVPTKPFVERFANAGIPVTHLRIGNDEAILEFEDDYFTRDGRVISRVLLARTPSAMLPLLKKYPNEDIFEKVEMKSLLIAMANHPEFSWLAQTQNSIEQFVDGPHKTEIAAAATQMGTSQADSLLQALEEYLKVVSDREEKLAEPTTSEIVGPVVLTDNQRVARLLMPTPYDALTTTWQDIDDRMKFEGTQKWVRDLSANAQSSLLIQN